MHAESQRIWQKNSTTKKRQYSWKYERGLVCWLLACKTNPLPSIRSFGVSTSPRHQRGPREAVPRVLRPRDVRGATRRAHRSRRSRAAGGGVTLAHHGVLLISAKSKDCVFGGAVESIPPPLLVNLLQVT